MLLIENLMTGYGKKQILNGISLEVNKGEIVGIIGHNGSGKSTLLRSILGILPVWKGTIKFDGNFIENRPPHENVRNGISLIIQGSRVFTDLSVLENLEVAAYLLNDKKILKSRLNYIFDLFPLLKERKRQNAGKLSGGEQQMLTLGNALMLRPKFLLLDEPSLGLSPKYVEVVFRTLQEINHKFKITMLIVEQKVRRVLQITDRVYILKLGIISFAGKSKDLLEDDRLRKDYL